MSLMIFSLSICQVMELVMDAKMFCYILSIYKCWYKYSMYNNAGACPGGGPKGPAPPLEIEKKEKKGYQSKY